MSTTAVDATAAALETEEHLLDEIVADLDAATWARPTPAPRWTIHTQIGHLAVSEDWATLAATNPEAFATMMHRVAEDPVEFGRGAERQIHDRPNGAVLAWWRTQRAATIAAARALPDGTRVPWFGPPMSVRSFLTARLMETWAHGQDVRDALGLEPSVSDRLRDVAHLGVVTRAFAYANRGLATPDDPVSVVLSSPCGELWKWGPDDAEDRVQGPALDFCLVVTQRRNVASTALGVRGNAAEDWMRIAQVFAGPPTDPPAS